MCTSVVSCSDVVVNIIFFLHVYIFYIISPVFIFLFKKMPILQQEKDAYEMRRFSVKPHCSEEGRNAQHTEIHNRNNCVDKSSPECHIFRLPIVHYASASGLCSRKASHTSLSCMFM